jgi:hypothetical protein
MICSGNGDMTFDEQKSHFTACALMKSTLLISTDVRLDIKASLLYKQLSDSSISYSAEHYHKRNTRDSYKPRDHCYQPRSSGRDLDFAFPLGSERMQNLRAMIL